MPRGSSLSHSGPSPPAGAGPVSLPVQAWPQRSSVQRPGGLGDRSGGDSRFIPTLARAAVAAGCDGLFLETHPRPARALSDGPNMVRLRDLPQLMAEILRVRAAVV